MKDYESPKAELIKFEKDNIITGNSDWGTNCPYHDAGNYGIDDDDCDLYQYTDDTYDYPFNP